MANEMPQQNSDGVTLEGVLQVYNENNVIFDQRFANDINTL